MFALNVHYYYCSIKYHSSILFPSARIPRGWSSAPRIRRRIDRKRINAESFRSSGSEIDLRRRGKNGEDISNSMRWNLSIPGTRRHYLAKRIPISVHVTHRRSRFARCSSVFVSLFSWVDNTWSLFYAYLQLLFVSFATSLIRVA